MAEKSGKDSLLCGGHGGKLEGDIFEKPTKEKAEADYYKKLNNDALLKPFVPKFVDLIEKNGKLSIKLQNVIKNVDSYMDCKIGTRTYHLTKNMKPEKKWVDKIEGLLELVGGKEIPPEATKLLPTKTEKEVIKPRYMKIKEYITSSNTLGFRIEGRVETNQNGVKVQHDKQKIEILRTEDEILDHFKQFVSSNTNLAKKYKDRLVELRDKLNKSDFFKNHQIVGSSLFFTHDKAGNVNVWMIDFGQTKPAKSALDHRSEYKEGKNEEDGYLKGLDNIIRLFEKI